MYIHRSPRKSSKILLGCFERLLVGVFCNIHFALHCVVLAAIMFVRHPYIESATTLGIQVTEEVGHN